MRSAALLPLALFLGVATSGCAAATSYEVTGSAEYVWTPSHGAENAGAVPLDALVCLGGSTRYDSRPKEVVFLGSHCELRSTPQEDGTLALSSDDGTCMLPMAEGLVRINLDFAKVELNPGYRGRRLPRTGDADVVVAGTTPGGLYVSYRFAGKGRRNVATGSECEGVVAD